jgi:hypothetical protein
MKFFITDETNITRNDKFDFFVYGGMVVDELELKSLSKKIISLKKGFNIKEDRPIKWPNVKWNGEGVLDLDIHSRIKSLILEMVGRSKCKIIICLSPQDFYHNNTIIERLKIKSKIDPEKHLRTQKYALNACLGKFDKLLLDTNDFGMILADSFNEQHRTELTKHSLSLYPSGGERELKNIVYPIIQVNNEHSHIHQINDVVLGAITYSMREMAENFLPIIKNNFWGSSDDGFLTIEGKGISIYPKKIATPQMEEKVQKLKEKFSRLIV